MTKTTRVLSAFVAMILLLSALGCGGGASGRAALYGKWGLTDEASGLTMEFEFKQDGTLTLGVSGMTVDMKFEFVDDDTIKLTGADVLGGSDTTMDFKVEGDKLTLTVDGESQVLTKVK
jgi:hypothetical protein